ncbi:hypothetical protein C2857_001105 [Epichloe festucae Fl1]|uniref:Uncharacterized protein n=1 Tax=Epichloe festucae (strain Fl1) TaxID=877507 RepID=A0A7U3Q2C9_EPIFF|nr:hypothetical protein C2857_001105 [Epichloe festucae Fl1]
MHLPLILAALAATATAALDALKIVQQIAPNATSCPDPVSDPNKECRTAEQAAPFIAQSMEQYGIYSPAQMAAVVALLAFESVDFRYKHNVYPGRAGQGTANMQTAQYNLLYAKQIEGVACKVAGIPAVEGQSNQTLNYILSLVQPDEHNFGSGPWFLKTQCGSHVREKLDENVDQGFEAYMQCVGVSVTEERRVYFERAKKAFGLA